jgi:hypothetical protein
LADGATRDVAPEQITSESRPQPCRRVEIASGGAAIDAVYVTRRLLALIPTSFFVSLIVFVTALLIPGDPGPSHGITYRLQSVRVRIAGDGGCPVNGSADRRVFRNRQGHRDRLRDTIVLDIDAGSSRGSGWTRHRSPIEMQPMEYAAFLSAMTNRTMTAGY